MMMNDQLAFGAKCANMENGKHRNIADALACNGPPLSTPSDTKCVCVEITHFKLKLKLTGAGGRVTVQLKFNDVDYEYYTSLRATRITLITIIIRTARR